jgi:hypothetical protein
MSRARLVVVALVALVATACREPDLAPLRSDLASSAALVCAPPVTRPAHAPPTRQVTRGELEAALVKLCEQQEARAEANAELLALLHEALAHDTAVAGDLRRSRLMIDAARLDLAAVRPSAPGTRTAEEALAQSANKTCGPSWAGLDRVVLAAASAQSKAGHAAEALALCADVIALARDEDLTGGLTDLLLANGQIQRAYEVCGPMLGRSPKEDAARFARSLAVLRASFPASLDGVVQRDRAEMMLFSFGKAREPGHAFACERAQSLAAASDGRPLTRGERMEAERAWRAVRAETGAPDDTYATAYEMTLRVLDRLIAQAHGG